MLIFRLIIQENLPMNDHTTPASQKIAVTGAGGFVGKALCTHLLSKGHTVIQLSRGDGSGDTWNPETGALYEALISTCDVFIHLAGESIAGYWTEKKKAAIRDSRVGPTRRLAERLASLPNRPHTFVCASASGFYGNRGNEVLTEESTSGAGFLAEVCREWEAATQPAEAAGIRVVNTRFSLILDKEGGSLAVMLIPFRLGLGGVLGSGKQWMSWITLQDTVRAIEYIIAHDQLAGPINFATPHPVTNRELTRALGRVLRRPTGFVLPAWAARLALREAADEMLLTSIRMLPVQLEGAGFEFTHTKLKPALVDLLKE